MYLYTYIFIDPNIIGFFFMKVRPRGLEELDQIGETALLQNLPGHHSASFTTRKQQNLSMNELKKKVETPTTKEPPKSIISVSDTPPSISLLDEDDLSDNLNCDTNDTKETTKSKDTIPTNENDKVVDVPQVKLSELSITLKDIIPHPELSPIWLTGRDVDIGVRLHPTKNAPASGVSVFVLTLINNSDTEVTIFCTLFHIIACLTLLIFRLL